MLTFRESLKDKSEDERKEAIKANRDELKKWAEDNKIPLRFMLGGFGGHHGDGPGMPPK
jgi:hypothetical protein